MDSPVVTTSIPASLVVEASLPRERLDSFLRERFPHLSRVALRRFIEEGRVRVNGEVTKAAHHPRAGERIEIEWPEIRPASVRPEAIPLQVLFEDDVLLVINKPAELVVHPAAGHEEHTLVNALLHHCQGRLSGIGGVARPGIVHRMDKGTTGCLVVAKNDVAHLSLARQFASREVQKIYHTLAVGDLQPRQGEVRAAIARHPTHRKRMAVTTGGGRAALTRYQVVRRLNGVCLVKVWLHTGRTHQVRVHLLHLGHPLLGDHLYGKRANQRLSEATGFQGGRPLLHAWELAFSHPVSGERCTFNAPWPEDFREAVDRFRRPADGPVDESSAA